MLYCTKNFNFISPFLRVFRFVKLFTCAKCTTRLLISTNFSQSFISLFRKIPRNFESSPEILKSDFRSDERRLALPANTRFFSYLSKSFLEK